jgi:hypothetical protein
MLSKIFKIFSILSALILMGFVIFSWNDLTNKNMLTIQALMISMFVFGGIDNLLNKQRIMKIMGILYFAVAIFITFVLISKYS